MHKSFVSVNGVATCVRTWGRWIEEKPSGSGDIVILITGNPGLTGYYDWFLKKLHDELKVPCWALGHAGHEEPKDHIMDVPPLEGNHHLYDLKGQVDHKVIIWYFKTT